MNGAVFTIFVLPFLIGLLIRSVFLRWKRGYIISGLFVLISVAAWIWTKHLVSHGTDGTVLLWACMAAMLAAGSLLVGGISLLIQKAKH